MKHLNTIKKEIQDCIDICRGCHEVCVETMYYSLAKGGEHSSSKHIGILLDCAQICETSADFMSRNSELHGKVCGICAEICWICAEECAAISGDDDQMKACEKECRKCAESCRKTASM